jgi:hypothetical protein
VPDLGAGPIARGRLNPACIRAALTLPVLPGADSAAERHLSLRQLQVLTDRKAASMNVMTLLTLSDWSSSMRVLNQIRYGITAASLLALCAGLAQPVAAQDQSKYSLVQFRDSLDGKQAEHRQLLTTAWLKSSEHAVKAGELHGALVLRLTGPGTAGSDYDFVTVVYPVKTPDLTQAPRDVLEARAKAAGFADRAAYQAALRGAGRAVRSAMNVLQVTVGTVPVGSFVRVAQFEIPREHRAAVRAYHREYTIPMNTARVKQGTLLAWSVVTPAVISDEEAGWTETTSVVAKSGAGLITGPAPMTEETFRTLAPGKNYAEYIRRTQENNAVRRRVRTRLYEVIGAVGTVPNTGGQ